MRIYHYSPESGEYLRSSMAQIDPLETETQGENVYLIPAYATDIEPPIPGANKAAVYDGDTWTEVDDYRGEWYLDTGEKIVITSLGEPLPAGATEAPPPLTLDELKTAKKNNVKATAQSKINNVIPSGWRQLNALARGLELEKLAREIMITVDEQTEMDELLAKWDRIKAIRTASDVIEADIDDLATPEDVETYDIAGSSHWPE